jgi:glycosidase
MNYPLGEAVLGFAGGSHLDMAVIGLHREYSVNVHPLDGPGFGRRLMDLAAAYDPAALPVQLNLLGSHDTPRLRTMLGGRVDRVLLATLLQMTLPGAPCVYYGDEIGLTGGTDPECRGAFPWDQGRWEPGLRTAIRGLLRLRAAEPALRDSPLRVIAGEAGAVAYLRGAGASRFVVVVNAADDGIRLGLRLDDAAAAPGERLVPVELPGFSHVAEMRVVDGAVEVELGPRTGTILRIV